MPDRIVREAILNSEKVNALSPRAELFYRRLMSKADDYGLYQAHPKILLGQLYSMQIDKVRWQDIEKWLDECVKVGLIQCYEVEGKCYLEIDNFGQRLRQQNAKWPMPPWRICKKMPTENKQLELKVDSESLSLGGHSAVTPHARARGSNQESIRSDPTDRLIDFSQTEIGPSEPEPKSKPIAPVAVSESLLRQVREDLSDFAKDSPELEVKLPPEQTVTKIAAMVAKACNGHGDPVKQFNAMMQSRYVTKYRPRAWPWFEKVVRNSIKDGEIGPRET